jgi:hypothetical protein
MNNLFNILPIDTIVGRPKVDLGKIFDAAGLTEVELLEHALVHEQLLESLV